METNDDQLLERSLAIMRELSQRAFSEGPLKRCNTCHGLLLPSEPYFCSKKCEDDAHWALYYERLEDSEKTNSRPAGLCRD